MGCRRALNLLLSSFLIFTATFHVAFSVDDYSDGGLISIDCGSTEPFIDADTGRNYTTDQGFVDTGTNSDDVDDIGGTQLTDLRYFTEGKRNCYVLPLGRGGNYHYLIRALFRYGNYDKKNQIPEFDLYIGINRWKTVKATDPEPDDYVYHEIIYNFPTNTESVDVCLVNTDRGTPFISALELRPIINSSIYPADSGIAFSKVYGYDIGYHPGKLWDVTNVSDPHYTYVPVPIGGILPSKRYKDDPYDRIWSQYSGSDNDTSLEWYTVDEDIGNDAYGLPQAVWKTNGQPRGKCINFLFSTTNQYTTEYYAYFHLADFYSDVQRDMRIYLYGEDQGTMLAPYMEGSTKAYHINKINEDIKLSICTDSDSDYSPILNAIELYEGVPLSNISTNPEDVKTMKRIKESYGVQMNWQGDPCLPADFSWSGLSCSSDEIPSVTAVNLSSSNLTGTISSLFSNLTSIEILDLSNNNLYGGIPEFLAKLPRLRVLNLSVNQLNGFIPVDLIRKMNDSSLNMSIGGNPGISWALPPPSSTSKNVIVPTIAATVAVTLVIVLAIALAIVWWKRKHKRRDIISKEIVLPQSKEVDSGSKRYSKALQSKNPEFSYSLVLRITNNFQSIIGGGGFGKVYLGTLENGTKVAVKLLSENSVQSKKEFYSEAVILSKIHHANLVSLVGYCNDGQNMVLIYEYMPNGNLRQHLSEHSPITLDWRRRLEIAINAAQGLDYLHNGCRPPIIHRDVKTSNILLDENWQAKIADFGLSRNSAIEGNSHTTVVAGTFAYMDPEYLNTRKMNKKSDVYSFGVVLLELITGKPAMLKGNENFHVIHWTRSLIENGDIQSIMDPKLYGNYKPTIAWKAVEIAMSCVSPLSVQRPEISQVFVQLKECLAIEIPREKSEGPRTMSSVEMDTSMFPCPR